MAGTPLTAPAFSARRRPLYGHRRDRDHVVEHADNTESPLVRGLTTLGRYRYGDTALTLLARPPQMGDCVVKSMGTDSTKPEHAVSAAVYAGSFDPITNGHVAIIKSGLVAFERIIVARRGGPARLASRVARPRRREGVAHHELRQLSAR